MVFEGLKTLEGHPDYKTLNKVACLTFKARRRTRSFARHRRPSSAEYVRCVCLRKMTGLHEETLAPRRPFLHLTSNNGHRYFGYWTANVFWLSEITQRLSALL